MKIKLEKLALKLDFERTNDYLGYVMDSYTNGNKTQFIDEMKKIRKIGEIETILSYFDDMGAGSAIYYYAKTI